MRNFLQLRRNHIFKGLIRMGATAPERSSVLDFAFGLPEPQAEARYSDAARIRMGAFGLPEPQAEARYSDAGRKLREHRERVTAKK